MGQKVNPISLRIGINRLWDSKWYAGKKKYQKMLHQDFAIEEAIRGKLKDASVSKIEILRTANAVTINIHSGKPGLIIGRGGETIEKLREYLEHKFDQKFSVNIVEIKQPNLDAHLVAESIVKQIERRISYRRASKMAIDRSLEAGAQGVKVRVAGRLNGVEIARSEFFSKGKIPLHTFRADIDYAYLPAKTTYGVIGVKVWIYKGDVFKEDLEVQMTDAPLAGETKDDTKKEKGKKQEKKKQAPKKTTKKRSTTKKKKKTKAASKSTGTSKKKSTTKKSTKK
ncbi:30S ribosomal protein S3 [Candidatus Peregrinibacteria bacterium]|nr:30S ribosomal protein S3 [Candidatus Peregrinibacteria bacterium]